MANPTMPVPERPNARWSMDFVADHRPNGRRYRVLELVDDYSRECVLQIVDTSISGGRIARALEQLRRPLPNTTVLDNCGSEFTAQAMFLRARGSGVQLHFIEPGKPTQNAFVESFNGKFRNYCLNLDWFASLADARECIAAGCEH